MNYQFEIQDHIHTQVQFQKMDNLLKCQYGSQKFNVGQVQMGAKLKSWFPKLHDSRSISIELGIPQRLIKAIFLL